MKLKYFAVLLSALLTLFVPKPLSAYVAGTTTAAAGTVEASAKLELMRGLAGPQNLPESQQKLTPTVNLYEFASGYTFGNASIFQDIKLKLLGTYFTSEAERLLGVQYYSADTGWILGAEISTNLIHDPDKVLGFFLRAQHPLGMNLAKFVNPKIDRLGLGVQSGFKFSDDFAQEALVYLASGMTSGGYRQNASLSASLLWARLFHQGIFRHGAALKFGPFVDGDIAQRNDSAYQTEGIRSFRLGFVTAASYQFSPHWGFDVSYIQKISGAYFRATKDFIFTLRASY